MPEWPAFFDAPPPGSVLPLQIAIYRSDVIVKIGVTFLCPLGKVTKESGIGEAFEARAVSTRIHPPLCTPSVAHLGRFSRVSHCFFAISIRFFGDAAGDT